MPNTLNLYYVGFADDTPEMRIIDGPFHTIFAATAAKKRLLELNAEYRKDQYAVYQFTLPVESVAVVG